MKAPLFVVREHHRHRAGHSYNEWSGRYSKLEAEFYVPDYVRTQLGKPGAYRFEHTAGGELPFAGDQPFWAERLRLLGVAPETTGGRNVDAHSLRLMIDAAGTTEMRTRAEALGEKMRAEDGLASAVATIESLLDRA